MSTTGVNLEANGVDDHGKRHFLVAATSVVGAVGVGFVAWPFLASLQPSAKAKAAGAPVEVDISKIEDGQKVTVKWRGKPIWILKRTAKMLADLPTLNGILRDPDSNVISQQPAYAKNPTRSIKPEYLVVIGICTHLGCSPSYVTEEETTAFGLGSDWKGGFFCPCHGSKFDLAGRVYQGVPAPTNLVIPPYTYLSDTRILIGVDQKGAA